MSKTKPTPQAEIVETHSTSTTPDVTAEATSLSDEDDSIEGATI